VTVGRRTSKAQSVNASAQRLDSKATTSEEESLPPRKFIVLMQSSSAPPSSWIDWLWPVCWPALAVIYLTEVNVLHPFYLVAQAVFPAGHFFT